MKIVWVEYERNLVYVVMFLFLLYKKELGMSRNKLLILDLYKFVISLKCFWWVKKMLLNFKEFKFWFLYV